VLEPEKEVNRRSEPSSNEGGANPTQEAAGEDVSSPEDQAFDESLIDEVAGLIDNARNYAEAEIIFQKTRIALTGSNAAAALALFVLAVVLLHIAIIAAAVGFVMALAPIVSIWWAIAIVVGVLLVGTGLLVWRAVTRIRRIAAMYDKSESTDTSKNGAIA